MNLGTCEGAGLRLQKRCDIFITLYFWSGKSQHPCYIGLAIIKPELPAFLSSLHFPISSLAKSVAFLIPLIYINFTWWYNVLLMTILLICYAASALVAIEGLR